MNTRRQLQTTQRELGSQLFEFALVLPLLLFLVAGVADFAQGWNLRQVLANAARDGARLGATESAVDLSTTNPQSIQEVCQQVADYLIQEHVNLAFMGISGNTASDVSTGCSTPGTIADSVTGATAAWTYYSTGTYGLKIEPYVQVPVTAGSTCGPSVACITSVRVTLTYPYNWTMGMNYFASGSNSTIPIPVYSTMPHN